MHQENNKNLSIIIPVYNEDQYIEKLFQDLLKFFNNTKIEVIFINDGSYDNSSKVLENLKNNYKFLFSLSIINLQNNTGKGNAVREGMKLSTGEYILLQDADLELDMNDSKELYEIISNDKNIKCIFGSRYLSGKLKKHNYFVNQLYGKINTIIFNIFFGQSLTDIHCGLKIIHREVYEKINLSINDFGLEIDIASQIIKHNFFIYEVGVSYFSRTIKAGKKITWIDGVKAYYYLFKVRFLDNTFPTKLSIIISSIYMTYVGSYFGMGLGNTVFIFLFFILGLVVGLNTKVFSTLFIFLFIYIGSFFGQGNGKTLSVLFFFILSILIIRKIKSKLLHNKIIANLI